MRNTIKKRFYSKSIYYEKYLRTKIKSYEGIISTNVHEDKIPNEGAQTICLSVILIDSVFRTGKNLYPQVFLEERKYVVKEKKRRCLNILLAKKKFPLMRKILTKKILIKKLLVKKFIVKNRSLFKRAILRMYFLREHFILKRLDDSDKK